MIATGCRARRLGAAGEHDDVLTLRTLDDAWRLRRRLADRAHRRRRRRRPAGHGDRLGLPVGRVRGHPRRRRAAAARPARRLPVRRRRRGGRGRTGLRIVTTAEARLGTRDGRSHVVLADGRGSEADLVVTAVGDLPNVEWLAASGLLRGGPLVVDTRGRVRPDIVAAGDVAVVPTPSAYAGCRCGTARSSRARSRPPRCCAATRQPLESRPYFWTEQFGLSLKAVGHLPLDGHAPGRRRRRRGRSAVLRWGGGHAAAVAVNVPDADPAPASTLRGARRCPVACVR